MSVSPVLAALRLATAEIHQAIESDSCVESRLRDLVERPVMVARFLDLHRLIEAFVAPWEETMREHGFVPAARSRLIRDDLGRLGAAEPTAAARSPSPNLGEALGWVYVAEGSMLGGRLMRRSMVVDGIPLTGLGFLDPWGNGTGERWRTFVDAMESACASGRALREDVLKGGRDAFNLAYALLVPHRPTESAE